MRLEITILKDLVYNEEFSRKVLPFLKEDYFSERSERLIFKEIEHFINTYNTTPTQETLRLYLNDSNIVAEEFSSAIDVLDRIESVKDEKSNLDWLVNKTEKFCQEKAVYNAILDSIAILDNKKQGLDKGAIPGILSDALSVSFDTSVGHDYIESAEARYDYYTRKEERIPFHLDFFNKITNGGIPKKTLNVILAPPHGGKSLMMCDFASNFQALGKNVLYISCEMAEEEIAKRIDANLMNISMDDMMDLSKPEYLRKAANLKKNIVGKLFIKEFPTATAGVNHFRTLLNELKLKKNFVPDVIFIDYLNICISSRIKLSGNVNSYAYVKAIGEELRGLAVEYSVPIITATQTNRSAAASSDPEMGDVSESFGIPAICDMMFAIVNSEELYNLNQIMIKQIKNRYADLNTCKRFVIGVDRKKMKLYDVESNAQIDIVDSGQAKEEPKQSWSKPNLPQKKSFSGIKV